MFGVPQNVIKIQEFVGAAPGFGSFFPIFSHMPNIHNVGCGAV